MRRVLDLHMRGQHIGESADFTAAHCIRLSGDGKRSGAGPADPAGGKMTVEDGADFVRAGGRLIDALAIDCDYVRGRSKKRIELKQRFDG